MFQQTFEWLDLPRVAFLAFLEILLSADNALVLGLLVKKLPISQRKKALFIGLFSAFVFRGAGLLAVSFLLRSVWIQIFGALYLFYLSISHFIKKKQEKVHGALLQSAGFWKTVLFVEIYDLAFAIDSILVALAFISSFPKSDGGYSSKLWIVYVGALFGIVFIRYAAHLFSSLIEKFPRMENMAFMMIGWIGCKLFVSALSHYQVISTSTHSIFEALFWVVFLFFFSLGFIKGKESHG